MRTRKITGFTCCLAAAVGYAMMNTCLRSAAPNCDPVFVALARAVVPAACLAPFLALHGFRRTGTHGLVRAMVILSGAASLGQLGGNCCFQYGVGTIGLTLAVPVTFAVMIVGGALMSWALMGERISQHKILAITCLVAAVVAISAGAAARGAPGCGTPVAWREFVLGFSAVCLAGISYAILTVGIRHVSGKLEPAEVVFIVTAVGVCLLAPITLRYSECQALMWKPTINAATVVAAGALNLFSFLLWSKGLQLISVATASVLNASQVGLSSLAGMCIFAERPHSVVLLGILLTLIGIVFCGMGTPDPDNTISSHDT